MKKYIIILSALATPLIFSSCGLYKKYERPAQVTASDSLYRNLPALDTTNSLADISWRELFTDPDLQALIDSGLRNNTDMQIARLKVTQAEASLKAARLAYIPSLSLAPQASASLGGNNFSTQTYSLAASASWEIDIFGKLTNAKLGAKSALERSQAYRQAVQTQLISTIANSYYSLLMLDKQLDVSRRTAKTWEDNVRVMKALKMAGRTNEAAVAQSEANRLSVNASLLTLEKQIFEMENSLSTLLATTPQSIKRGTLASQEFPTHLAVGVPLELLNRRPDIRQAEQALSEAFYATNVARAAFYPSITLGGTAGWTNSLGSITNPGSWLINAIGSLVQPLFNKGLNTAKLKIAKAQQEEALLTFQQSLLDAGAEVNNALMLWQTARGRLAIDAQQIEYLRSAVSSAKMLMQHSDANYLEVITAQQTLLNAELGEVNDQFGQIQGVINLYHSLGGGEN